MCKNVFAINNGIIVLIFHELDLTKGRGRDLHGPGSDARPVAGPTRDFSNEPGRAGKCKAIFPTGRAGPANKSRFFQRAGPGRQLRGDFSDGPGRAGK